MRILTRQDVKRAVSMARAIEVMKDAFAQLSNNTTHVPLRVHLPVDRYNGIALFMPAYLSQSDALAVKVVTVYAENAARGLPLIHAVVVVLDAQTGRMLALIEGSSLTALRTAAGAGAATDVLARRDARVGLVFGTGVQGRAAVRAIATARPLERVHLVDAVPGRAEQAAQELLAEGDLNSDIVAGESTPDGISRLVTGADIIHCASTSKTPLFNGNDVRPGTHVNAIGVFTPDAREVDSAFVKRCSKIVVDAYSGALAEAGDLLIPINEGLIDEDAIYAELGEITSGKVAGRTRDDEITFFKSVGNAVQDAAIAQAILLRAEELGLGLQIEL
jgi:ornithine cyclodeaminase/alanine dehydrogenase-like protein (mu-crystallin family)